MKLWSRIFCFAFTLAGPAIAQQNIPPFATTYGNFSAGIKLQGSYGLNGYCLISTGSGSAWLPCSPGSGITQLTGDAIAGPGTGSQVVTVKGLNSVPFCTGFSPTNGQAVTLTTASSPNPCWTAATPSGSGISQLTGDVAAGPGSGSQAATVNGLKGVPFCTGFTPTNGQALTLTTASSPNPCYTAATPAGSGTVNSGSSYAPTYYPSPGGTAVSGATPFSGIQYDSTSAPPAAATAAQVVAVIGSTAVTNATNAVNFSGSLSGDVTGTQSATSVVKVNGASVPTSKTIVGTNSSGQIVDASSATLSNNTTGTAAGLTSYPTKCTGINFSQGLSSGSNNCTAPVNSSGVYSACDLATETPGTYYCAINPGVVEVSATESQVQQPIPFTATMNNLYVRLTADPGNGNTVTVTQRISGSSQSLSCTITGNGSTNTTCSDTTHTDVFSGAGQSFDWQVVTVGVSTDTQLYISVRSLSY